MIELIRKDQGEKIYLRFAHGYENESLRKIGWSKDTEKRLKNYKSHGDISDNIAERGGDGVDEDLFKSYFQTDCYKHIKYNIKSRLKDLFCNSIFDIDKMFVDTNQEKIQCDIFDEFIDLVSCNSPDDGINLFYKLTSNKLDLKGLGLNPKDVDIRYNPNYEDLSLNYWLDTDPNKKRSIGFWRSVLYKFNDSSDYDEMIDNLYNTGDTMESVSAKNIYYGIANKIFMVSMCKEVKNLSMITKCQVCNLVLSYFCAKNTKNTDIRKEIRKEIDDILNTQRSGH